MRTPEQKRWPEPMCLFFVRQTAAHGEIRRVASAASLRISVYPGNARSLTCRKMRATEKRWLHPRFDAGWKGDVGCRLAIAFDSQAGNAWLRSGQRLRALVVIAGPRQKRLNQWRRATPPGVRWKRLSTRTVREGVIESGRHAIGYPDGSRVTACRGFPPRHS